ncbi:MAG TPA: hypothetical protein VKP67_10975 [Xanthobacteraceae bacterium]|nr:hypothetical protein [Xanthobacteraceae bacterium]
MRRVVWTLALAVMASTAAMAAPTSTGEPALAAPTSTRDFGTADAVLRWINAYRKKPDVSHVPVAVRTLSRLDALRETETAAVYVGFVAGVIGSNPQRADELVEKMLPIKAEDHWLIVRAVAYSGLPNWRDLLNRFANRMPSRRLMIEKYTSGKLPTLEAIAFDASPTAMDRVKGFTTSVGNFFTGHKTPEAVRLEANPEVLDTLWGYYFATASYPPVERILRMLPWSKDRQDTDKLTVGSMAKFTLASNATHDAQLLAILRREVSHQPEEVQPIVNEIIEAVDTMEIAHLRKVALAAIEDLKRKGPGYKRDLSTWGQIGQGALALGCVAAAATGQVELGLPCVVGGALGSATLNYWTKD